MKEKILGIDTGTNSLGWAIVEKEDGVTRLLEKGTNIFTEGVKIEKGIESSKAAERTEHRASRKHYRRRKVRKIRLLTILVENHMCPPVSKLELKNWRTKKIYPANEQFMAWQRTEDKEGINPYHYRYICLTEKLNLDNLSQRYILGRALYHLNQRRGFLSNRKDTSKESEGVVNEGISDLSVKIEEAGCQYLGEYFYKLYEKGEKIRNHYTARKEHYLKEFHAICEKQGIDVELVGKLEKAIFTQLPLKSQKGLVGTCKFEKGKSRCPSSHPLYEEFRMYSFLNNIKMRTPKDLEMRYLTVEEKNKVIPKFKRKSKKSFTFEDIAKELAGKNNYCFNGDTAEKPYRFNYQMDTNVAGCVVTAQLEEIFGDKWLDNVCEVYTLAQGKTKFNIMNDVWHALFNFDDEDRLREFGKNRLQLDDEVARKFSKISMPNDYASLSLKAIRKILPYMRDYGLIYSQAVFLANLEEVLPKYVWEIKDMREAAIEKIIDLINNYDKRCEERTLEQCIKDFLKKKFMVDESRLKKLYHPSMIELYPCVQPDDMGLYQLGSPRISSVRNPMAMHSLFRLRKVINLLLKEKKIDENTTIQIEFARELNDANMRNAIQQYQRNREKNHNEYRERIIEYGIKDPTERDILKYQLWEEQEHKCIYTGEEICIGDFLGTHPKYDIEHTVPRSVGGDSTMANMTLCNSAYNRDVKGTKLPTALQDYDAILQRIEGWKEKYVELDRRIRKTKGVSTSTKEEKDKNIRKRNLLVLERNYWRDKYSRFTMTEVPEGFARRQGVNIGLISRYARLYLKSVFKRVFVVKGIITSEFRKIWGIQDEYSKKERVNHVHHCIDAITIACIGKHDYDMLAQYYHDDEEFKWGRSAKKPQFPKPWPTFVEDIKAVQDEILVAHYNNDTLPKHTKKRDDKRLIIQGDTARASLHNDTYYGAISENGEVKYVVRRNLDALDPKDVRNIVDKAVREKVEQAIADNKNLKAAIEKGIWMNVEKKIPIKKVRVYTPSVVRPIHIRKHRDESIAEYKKQFHVQNDRNYLMAIYIGKDQKGKEKRSFELVNNIDAANYYKLSNDALDDLVPRTSLKGNYPLAYCLKIGMMVLLYEESPEEVWDLGVNELTKRLYKVNGLSSMIQKSPYGVIFLLHHQEARKSTMIKYKNGAYHNNEEMRAGIKMLHTQIKCLVQGVDFEINELGEIRRII